VAPTLSKIDLQYGDRVLDKGLYRPAKALNAYDNGPRHTIGFEPNTFVDISSEWAAAAEWLGRCMPFTRTSRYPLSDQ
jgi:hypothetical protein